MAEAYLLVHSNYHEMDDPHDIVFAAYSTKEAADRRRQTVIAAQDLVGDWDRRKSDVIREFKRVNNLARPAYRVNMPALELEQYRHETERYETAVAKVREQFEADNPEPPNPETWNDLVVVKVEYLD